MQVKTSELSGASLDWAAAKCEGIEGYRFKDGTVGTVNLKNYSPSFDWSQGGPIIEREGIRWNKEMSEYREIYYAWVGGHEYYDPLHIPMHESTENLPNPDGFEYGETLLISAMRCYVASKLGDVVDIPDELMESLK